MNKKLIYVVDDDGVIRVFLENVLTDFGYEVKTYSNGINFFEDIKVNPPDLIILDIMMSWIDGLEVCATLKSTIAYKDIPVIIITAYKEENMHLKIKNSKADAYMYKPFTIDQLFTKIEQLI